MVTQDRAEVTPRGVQMNAMEAKWRQRWDEAGIYTVDEDDPRPRWYSLTMYPYPSGLLHVGHWYAYTAPDIFARARRMQGDNVLFPMGYDAFGLPAENAAIKNGIHPATWTYENMAAMRDQFKIMGAGIDWSRELATCDPEFYRWNQWLFLRMMERGLAYRAAGAVWWCPNDQTVLANEQVIDGNVCERCGAEVYKRDLEQWYFRITAYAEELLAELEHLDWPDPVRVMQRNWIGRSEGARLSFRLEAGGDLEVFTTRPDTVFGATFMVLAPEHPLVETITTDDRAKEVRAYQDAARRKSEVERQITDETQRKTGVFTGAFAINPVNDERIPVWIADYVLMGYGTGAIMAVPAHDARDFAFARGFDLPVRVVIQPDAADPLDGPTMNAPYIGPGTMVNSGELDGTLMPERLPEVITWLEQAGRGTPEVTWRLRDWLISRQRYWGTPIPVIYCDTCGMVPVPEQDLPVVLPLDAEFTPTGQSPLESHEAFLNVPCPTCGGAARRETDTMDTFMDSSWYWFRFLNPHYEGGPIDSEQMERWTPVNLYTGGIEHAILHLLYARFFTRVLRDLGLVNHSEPFRKLRNQGMILSTEGVKMSKSRGSQIGAMEMVERYGVDALRLHLMFLGPWEQGGPWNDRGIVGMDRFIRRATQIVADTATTKAREGADDAGSAALRRLTHHTIARVTRDIEAFQFNTMIAALIEFTNELTKLRGTDLPGTPAWTEAVDTLVLLMAPGTPYVAEEMWETLGHPFSVHQQPWPVYDEALTIENTIELPVQINGRIRDRIEVAADATEDAIIEAARASERVREALAGKTVKRTIVVPGRLVNILV